MSGRGLGSMGRPPRTTYPTHQDEDGAQVGFEVTCVVQPWLGVPPVILAKLADPVPPALSHTLTGFSPSIPQIAAAMKLLVAAIDFVTGLEGLVRSPAICARVSPCSCL